MPQPGFPSQASAVPGNVQPSRSRGPPPFAAPFSLQLVPVPAGHLQSGPSAASSSPLAMRPAQMASLPVQPAPPKSRRRRHQTGPSEDRDGARAFIEALPKVDNALPLEGTDPQRDPLERPWCEPRLSSKKLQFTEPQRARNPTRGTMKDSRSVPPASSASSTSSASPYPPPATVGAVIVDPDGKLVSHRWLHKVSSGLREDRESLVGAQFTQLLAANPQLLVDRQQRIQATPNHSRTRFHLARSSEHFQSLAILLGPKDYITHSERSGCMNAEWYYMPGRNRALTAWTFDDIYTALYKYLDDHPQSFCKADGDVTVAPDQLLDFRCGSPSPSDNDNDDDATGQWNTLPGMPIRAVSDKDGHKELHIEVQVKRVGGTDLALASRCGVHYSVYGALNNDKGLAMPCQGHRNRVAPGQKSEASVHECVEKPFDRARLKDSGWQYVAKSHVYIVRLVARNATSAPHGGTAAHVVLKTGGWLVPPVEDRLRLYEKKHGLQEAALAPRPGMAGTSVDDVSSLPKPLAPLRAAPSPALNTHTNAQTPLLCGGTAPEVWTQLADPAVEDVLWMASKLITGTTFKGFRKGAGAGLDMSMAVNREYIRLWEEKVPYASPSRSATLHSDLLYLAHLAGHQLDRP
ncbi:hypothetical protein SCUCBS95973_006869 [Sporothrix curviconia]|uniref:Uncharacterized protein n=1 Tax=Sporothrix curviconia TaxID=1260050 RepID=A0ABP0C8P9_9PEZI